MAESDLDITVTGFNDIDTDALMENIRLTILKTIHRIPKGGISVVIKSDPNTIVVGDKVKFRNLIYRVLDIHKEAVRVGFNKWIAIDSVEKINS